MKKRTLLSEELNRMKQLSGIIEEEAINEKITDYFKSREEIANKFLEFLKKEPVKALNSILPYYKDFIDYSQYPHKRGYLSYGKTACNFLPTFCQIFSNENGAFSIDNTKLNLVSKITEKEVLNLVSTHENFSLKTIATDLLSIPLALAGRSIPADVPEPTELNPQGSKEFPSPKFHFKHDKYGNPTLIDDETPEEKAARLKMAGQSGEDAFKEYRKSKEGIKKYGPLTSDELSEIHRMRQLAGIIKEEEQPVQPQQGNVVGEIQALIDKNEFLKGNKVTEKDLIVTDKYILYVSDQSLAHIKERHNDGNKPGSLINPSANIRQVIQKVMSNPPSEISGGRVKWLDIDSGVDVGFMGVSKGTPEQVIKMADYTMPDGKKEIVKISQGQRTPTKIFNVITGEIGDVGGKKILSLMTAFPGGMSVDGINIPMDRGEMAKLGLYFVVNKPPAQAQQQPAQQPQ